MAVAADPTSVDAWLANFPTADGYEVTLPEVHTIDTAPGVATMTVEPIVGSTVISSASSS